MSIKNHVKILDGIRVMMRCFTKSTEIDDEWLRNTPQRVCDAFEEMTVGYEDDPEAILLKECNVKDEDRDQVILAANLRFSSLCAHHLMPFHGVTNIAYLPGPTGKVVGLSKLPRLLECYARRLQLQETLGSQIAGAVEKYLKPLGVAVIIASRHDCMNCIRSADGEMITSVMRGVFRDDSKVRAELVTLLEQRAR